jgi:hypothetical protein
VLAISPHFNLVPPSSHVFCPVYPQCLDLNIRMKPEAFSDGKNFLTWVVGNFGDFENEEIFVKSGNEKQKMTIHVK